jgi:hypothetical protein
MEMANQLDCPNCQSIVSIEKIGAPVGGKKVFVCGQCGHTFFEDGSAFIEDVKDLKEVNPIAAASEEILREDAGFASLSPAIQATLRASITSMLTFQWFEGYKHGVLAAALSGEYKKRQGEVDE